jgi:hypothetical protein
MGGIIGVSEGHGAARGRQPVLTAPSRQTPIESATETRSSELREDLIMCSLGLVSGSTHNRLQKDHYPLPIPPDNSLSLVV